MIGSNKRIPFMHWTQNYGFFEDSCGTHTVDTVLAVKGRGSNLLDRVADV